jgi:hypothetical protein
MQQHPSNQRQIMKLKLFLFSIALSPICAFATIYIGQTPVTAPGTDPIALPSGSTIGAPIVKGTNLTYAVCALSAAQGSAVITYSYLGNSNWLVSKIMAQQGQTTQPILTTAKGEKRSEWTVQGGSGQPSMINPVFIIDTKTKTCREGQMVLTLVTIGTN